jgi:cytochrome c553
MLRNATGVSALIAAVLAASSCAAADLSAGKKKAVATCSVCHGVDGLAKIPTAPNLAGNNAIYLVKQLNAFKTGERKSDMMSMVVKRLSDDDVANIAAWYSSLKVTVTMPQSP